MSSNASNIIWVAPFADGWSVRCGDLEPQVFRSGGRAEAQAKALAARLAEAGQATQVRIQDRAMNLVGAVLFPAA